MSKDTGEKCPECGGPVRYYHNPDDTKVVCAEKCVGWRVIETIDRNIQPKPTKEGGEE